MENYLPDIHTHSVKPRSIVNRSHAFMSDWQGWSSVGLHPWYIQQSALSEDLELLSMAVRKEQVLAIGECGLDKVCETPWGLQESSFIAQIKMANIIGKPLIIHCVRAYDEVQHLLNMHKAAVPVIFHGFNKSIELAVQLISKGYYLSFGPSIISPQKAAIFRQVPIDRVFLETDSDDVSIDLIYAKAADVKGLSKQALIDQIEKNIFSVFGKSL